MEHIRLGVSYYPEQEPETDWATDARLMNELGIDTVRVGEFCWSRMQKPDGTMTLDWLQRFIEQFDLYGIKTLLCTPTAAPPVWVCEKLPDLPLVAPDGRRGLFGGRRHYSPFHEGYRAVCDSVVAGLAKRFGKHEGVIGWQIDNEVGSYSTIDVSAPALGAFHQWVTKKYGTTQEVNQRWNLAFWNQEVERIDQLPAPTNMMCTRNPSMLLEYNRFCLEGWSRFILAQAKTIRVHSDARQFVTSNCEEMVAHALFDLQGREGSAGGFVDYAAVDNYPELLPEPGQNAMRLDRYRTLTPGRFFFAPEMQIGSSCSTTGGLLPEVRRYWAFETLARGARSLTWFHWVRFRGGAEWRLASMIERDRVKRTNFTSTAETIRQIRRVEPILKGAQVQADVQVLLSTGNILARDRSSEASFWMEIQLPDATQSRFPLWERETRRAVYLPFSRMGMTVGFVTEKQTWLPDKPLIISDADLVSDELAGRLGEFCRQGGTIICFPGAGERDMVGCHLNLTPPGKLAPLFGVQLQDYYPLEEFKGVTFDPSAGGVTRPPGAPQRVTTAAVLLAGTMVEVDIRHAEVLAPRGGALVLGKYQGGPCNRMPAVTTNAVGKGWAVYLGAIPANIDAACGLYRCLMTGLPKDQVSYRVVRINGPAGPHRFLLNDGPVKTTLKAAVRDLIGGQTLSELPPYGVVLEASSAVGPVVGASGASATGGAATGMASSPLGAALAGRR
jgi:beta-galactosidase